MMEVSKARKKEEKPDYLSIFNIALCYSPHMNNNETKLFIASKNSFRNWHSPRPLHHLSSLPLSSEPVMSRRRYKAFVGTVICDTVVRPSRHLRHSEGVPETWAVHCIALCHSCRTEVSRVFRFDTYNLSSVLALHWPYWRGAWKLTHFFIIFFFSHTQKRKHLDLVIFGSDTPLDPTKEILYWKLSFVLISLYSHLPGINSSFTFDILAFTLTKRTFRVCF